EAAHIGVGLLEPAVLGTGDREVADDVQRVPAPGGPAGHDGDDDLGHEPDQTLHLEDVQAAGAGRILDGVDGIRVLVAVTPADALVAARAERPAAVLGARSVAG